MNPYERNAMFKNRAVQMKFVKTDDMLTETTELPAFEMPSKEDVLDVSNELIKNTALAVISVIAAAALARSASDIIVHHATH